MTSAPGPPAFPPAEYVIVRDDGTSRRVHWSVVYDDLDTARDALAVAEAEASDNAETSVRFEIRRLDVLTHAEENEL